MARRNCFFDDRYSFVGRVQCREEFLKNISNLFKKHHLIDEELPLIKEVEKIDIKEVIYEWGAKSSVKAYGYWQSSF